jgi:DUF4097 and DUF4098 domain-containing protein YvlB
MMTSRLRFGLVAVIAAASLGGLACVDLVGSGLGKYTEREEKQFKVAGQPEVEVATFDGAIEVRPWDQPEVLVVIEKRGRDKAATDSIEVHADQNGNHVSVDVRAPKNETSWFGANRSAKLIVSVPAKSDLIAKSGDGSIDIERLAGRLDLRSGDGSINGRDIAGDLKAHTGDGSIKLEGLDGTLDVDTGDGSVTVGGKLTSVRARTGDGHVTIHASPGSTASGNWDIVTGDGSVTVELPEGFGAELDAHTGDGSVRLQDVTLSNVTGQIGKNSVKGTLGSGGHSMRVRTGDGSITLRRF